MFTQEQLGAIRNVFEESLKPFEARMDKRFENLETRLIQRMDEGFESHAEQIAKVSEQVTVLQKDMDVVKKDVSDIKKDMSLLKDDVFELRSDMRVLKRNKSIWVLGEGGDEPYTKTK